MLFVSQVYRGTWQGLPGQEIAIKKISGVSHLEDMWNPWPAWFKVRLSHFILNAVVSPLIDSRPQFHWTYIHVQLFFCDKVYDILHSSLLACPHTAFIYYWCTIFSACMVVVSSMHSLAFLKRNGLRTEGWTSIDLPGNLCEQLLCIKCACIW
jgi:hypothetical protein